MYDPDHKQQLVEALGADELPPMVERALALATSAHEGVLRKSGEKYINHPVAVACLAAEIVGADETTLSGALLHDVLEDTDVPEAEIIEQTSSDVLALVQGVTKLSKLDFPSREMAQIESYRKMIIAMAADIRVVIIKFADRIHNMRTIGSMAPDAQTRIAEETLAIYAPIAHRLGMHRVKAELEDRSFAVLEPEAYAQVAKLVEHAEQDRQNRLDAVGLELEMFLAEQEIDAEVSGRIKHLYSVHRKMVKKGQDFDQITDIVALRVLVDRVRDCYGALGLVHNRWQPIVGRIKDYIALPKLNGYRSLHTTVYADGKPLEIQIRTYEMHRAAEYGVAAHFEYKSGSPTARSAQTVRDRRDSFVASLSGSADETSLESFFTHLRDHLATEEEVYVYTPMGDIKVLPKGSTPLDFAYAVHTDVGQSCVGAKVNGKIVRLAHQLRSGDHVEVLTREGSTPSRDWLTLVASPRAKSKIRGFLAQSDRAQTEEAGRKALASALRTSHLPLDAASGPELVTVVTEMGYRRASDFYVAIGAGSLPATAVVRHLGRKLPEPVKTPRLRPRKHAAEVVNASGEPLGVAYQLARCCQPIPGDQIIGHVQAGRGLVVHRLRCRQLASRNADPQSLMELAWPTTNQAALTRLVVQGDNRRGMLEEVSSQIAVHGGNIMALEMTNQEGAFSLMLSVELSDAGALARMLAAVRSVAGVFDAWRVAAGAGPS